MATLTLAEIRATPLGKRPVLEELIAMVDHISQNQDDIGALTGGGDPGWNSSIDTRWLLIETGGVADTYVASMVGATGESLVEGFNYWLSGQISTTTGTQQATLNVGSLEGAVPIMKETGTGVVDLDANDLPLKGALLYYSASQLAWILTNPTGTGATITQSASQPSGGKDGDIWMIPE